MMDRSEMPMFSKESSFSSLESPMQSLRASLLGVYQSQGEEEFFKGHKGTV